MTRTLAVIFVLVAMCIPAAAGCGSATECKAFYKALEESVNARAAAEAPAYQAILDSIAAQSPVERACYDKRMKKIANDPSRPNMGTSTAEMVLAQCRKA